MQGNNQENNEELRSIFTELGNRSKTGNQSKQQVAYDSADILNQQRNCFSQKYVLRKNELLFPKPDPTIEDEDERDDLLSEVDVDDMLLNDGMVEMVSPQPANNLKNILQSSDN